MDRSASRCIAMVTLLAAGCRGGASRAQPPAPTRVVDGSGDPTGARIVETVLDPGERPRRRLRYTLDRAQALQVAVEGMIVTRYDGCATSHAMPARIHSFELGRPVATDHERRIWFAAAGGATEHGRGTLLLSDRGIFLGFPLDDPADPARDRIDDINAIPLLATDGRHPLSELVAPMLVPFPAQAVGVGARWRIVTSEIRSGVLVTHITDVRLRSLAGNRLVVELSHTAVAGYRKFDLPPWRQRISELEGLSEHTHGTVEIDLSAPLPIRGTLRSESSLRFWAWSNPDSWFTWHTVLDIVLRSASESTWRALPADRRHEAWDRGSGCAASSFSAAHA